MGTADIKNLILRLATEAASADMPNVEQKGAMILDRLMVCADQDDARQVIRDAMVDLRHACDLLDMKWSREAIETHHIYQAERQAFIKGG